MNKLHLSSEDVSYIQALLRNISAQYPSAEDTKFLIDALVLAHELPHGLRAFLNDFKQREPEPGVCVISGYVIDQKKIGQTPAHWRDRPSPSPALEEELFLVLVGSLLGEPFGWATQQNGYVVNNVVPIKEHEMEQLGSGSKANLVWHTEDYYHPYRGDYLALFCLRNPYNVPTTYAPLSLAFVNEDQFKLLFEPRFIIYPDQGHTVINKYQAEQENVAQALLERAYQRIEELTRNPEKVPLLFGSPEHPFMRIDPTSMDDMELDKEAQQALHAFMHSIDESLQDVVLEPGDLCIIDNNRTVHGRKPFTACYDGTDRWLKRINITRDLRKSSDTRTNIESRIVF